ncbi:hypothetical protein DET49_13816 [Salegentibacter sp. 24]|uniref:DUF7793 family protein n=1 Tax=Salegentibacter sp. 24 TaxID=2183986 RepID=UPI00105CB0D0|nr:STAS/SEC14 domain-containing protein [Salegentibacter sp. 24]TDN79353.1 hypothetical protein DET49_13816 [Salegentibacter sp. 24]
MFEGRYGKFWIRDDILFVVYKPELVISLKVAKQVVRDRLEVQQNLEYPVFCDLSGVTDSSLVARRYLVQEGTLLIKALAFYTTSPVAVRLTEFYLKTLNHKVPTKFFTNKDQAINFLKPYMDMK